MTDRNLLFSPDLTLNLLSKSSPSQLQPFQLNRSRTQPLPTEAFYVSSQKTVVNNNNNNNLKPSNLSHVPCKFYKQGTCTAGANCTFSHSSDLSSESAVCKYFVKGNCKFGTKCALLHTMSPYGNTTSNSSKTSNNNNANRMIMGTPPPQQQLSFIGRRKTSDQQMMSYSTSTNSNSFLHDPFASSAPSISLFQQQYEQQHVWRNNNSNFMTGGVRSSPRETGTIMDHTTTTLLGSSPFSNNNNNRNNTILSTSMRSNNSSSGYNNNNFNINNETGYRRQLSSSSYITPGSIGNHLNDDYFISKETEYDDLNDAMLPSSLNDLFTPNELHVRRVRQQEFIDDSNSSSRIPFYIKPSLPSSGYENSTAAINIPAGGNNSGSSGSGSSESYLQQREDFSQHDDDVQFFMEDDEAVTYDTKNHMNNTTNTKNSSSSYNNFPSLISLPST